jgi:hypothetical protein
MAVVRKKNDGNKINISQINDTNRNDDYECIVCGSEVIPVVPNGKTITGENAKVTPHFKHLNAENCGQESFVHFWTKTELIKIGDKFKVITDKENEYIANQIFFEKTIDIDGKKYIPDATIHTSCGNIIHFEFNHSNNKRIRDYIDKWKKLNQIIVEVNINSMMCVFEDSIPTFKALYYEGKCFNLNDEDKLYYDTIGEYKLTKSDKETLKIREKEIKNLDWLWDEIRKIKYENKDYEGIGNLIRSISTEEGRQIAINILSRVKCGGSILYNYVMFLKDKVDRRLKHLNLKYNGYLIKYETEIPRLIYDRVFKGITIKFYVLDDDIPEIYHTYKYDFKEEILSNKLKERIDYEIKKLSNNHDLLLHILDILKLNNKIVDSKLHYKDNTDYVDAIYFTDYRNNNYLIYKDYYSLDDINSIFIAENIKLIRLGYLSSLNIFIVETQDSYEFKNRITVKYKYNQIFKQNNINLTYLNIDKSYKFLPRYDFVKKVKELLEIQINITDFINNYITDEHYSKIYNESVIEISNSEIDKKIEQLLYPMIYISNQCNTETLNIRLNKDFTKGSEGFTQGWLIKDFIAVLYGLDIKNINNIE